MEVLAATPGAESLTQIEHLVKEFVDLLTGKQTIYQTIRLAEEVEKRGGEPLRPLSTNMSICVGCGSKLSIESRGWKMAPLIENHAGSGSMGLLEELRARVSPYT